MTGHRIFWCLDHLAQKGSAISCNILQYIQYGPVPVGILENTLSMFDKVNPLDSLVDREEGDIGYPEENIEQRHVHVVVVTIIDQASISVF